MTAQILQLRRPRSCVGCHHFTTGMTPTVEPECVLWAEPIDDETVGATCPDYQHEGTAR